LNVNAGAGMTGAANGNIVADLSGNIDAKVGNQVSVVNRSIEHGWLFCVGLA